VRDGQVMPVATPVQVGGEGPGQLPGMRVGSDAGGLVDDGEQYRQLGGEPVQCPLLVGEVFRSGAGLERGGTDLIAVRVEQPGGGVCGVQIVVQCAVDGGV